MGDVRKRYGSKFKARVALEAIKGEKTAAELASEYAVHVSQITRWKKRVMASLPDVFSEKHEKDRADAERLQEELYNQIGRLKVEVDWLKKNLDLSTEEKRKAIEFGNKNISISRQCELLGLSRSALYYNRGRGVGEKDLELMRMLDEQYTKTPLRGYCLPSSYHNILWYG